MKAAQISEYGDPSVVKVVDIPKPEAREGQVLVEVHASSLNPFDSSVRAGKVQQMVPSLPVTLGGDIAGVIVELGKGVSGFSVGDKVYGQANAVAGNSGAFAEYAATKASQLAKAPSNLGMAETASMPLVGVSALQAVTKHIQLQPGQKILIHGGTGGIGSIAVQVAKHIGAYVATTVPGNAVGLAKELGADEVIDFQSQNFEEVVSGYDAVFDTAGGEVFEKSLKVLKQGGIAVSMTAGVDDSVTNSLGVTAITQGTKVTTEALNELAKLIEDGVITPHIGKTFPLDEIQEAFKARESGSVIGKITLQVKA
jgi:NADPH:quinone reductase-like Zn-dependent oxidoreductase